jgi:adenylate cyclase
MQPDERGPHARSEGMERRLAAILHADVQGYSRRIETDEVATLRVLTPYLQLMTELVRQHGGHAIGSRGDSLLAEFPSVRNAVQCAVEMQQELTERNAELPPEQHIAFRMGIHVGEVVEDGAQLHGDGINIAVRIEGLAEAGGICLSGSVYDQVKNKLPLQYGDLGPQHLKNIAEPVRVYRVVLEGQRPTATKRGKRFSSLPPGKRAWRNVIGAGIVLLLLVGGIGTLWYQSASPPHTPHSATPQQADKALPLPNKPSIVVLPFVNLSKDPEQEYFSDGITEVLTSDLSRISSLFVIARNTAFTYKGKPVNMQAVGRELGVRYVMEGSVQKAGEHVRIVAQVIDTTTGGHIWPERYDRPLQDIFALQDEIVQRIVTTLKLQLTLQEHGYIVRKHTDNLEAYDAFLRGVEYYRRYTKEANAQARQLFEKAAALDPQYAEAYVGLGVTYWLEWLWRWSADPQNLGRAFTLARQALALDDSLPVAHSVLSLVYVYQQQYDQAIAEGERVIALDPNNADSYQVQAEVLNVAGRPEDALRLVEQAMRLNPRYPPTYLFQLGLAYRLTGRYAEAIATLKECISRNPNLMTAHLELAISYLLQWDSQLSADPQTLEQALAAAHRVTAVNDSFFAGHLILGLVYLFQK